MGLYSKPIESYAPNSIMPSAADDEVQRAILERYEANVGQFGNNTAEIKDIISLLYKTQLIEDTLNEVRSIDQKMQDYMKLIDDYYPRLEEIIDKLGVLDNIMEVYNDIVNVQKPYIDKQVAEVTRISEEIGVSQRELERLIQMFREEVQQTLELVKSYALASVYAFWDEEDSSNFIVLDPSRGSVSHHILQHPSTDINFAQFATEPTVARQLTAVFEQGTGANKLTWPASVKWSQDRVPVLSLEAGRKDVVTLLTYDEGKTWLGFFNGGWFK